MTGARNQSYGPRYLECFSEGKPTDALYQFIDSAQIKEAKIAADEKAPLAPVANTMQSVYAELDVLFRQNINEQNGIVSFVLQDEKLLAPTGIALVRDARNAKAIGDPSINEFQIEIDNVALSCLCRVRSIDYALSQLMSTLSESELDRNAKHIYQQLRNKLLINYKEFIQTVASKQQNDLASFVDDLQQHETAFNTVLCEVLREANLDEGCHSKKDYEALLFHYRNLSALLDPAKALVTVAYDAKNHVVHRTTQHPVTEKTEVQKEAIHEEMSTVTLCPGSEEETFQSVQCVAKQEANRLFATLAADDKRMLPAQTRKTHLHGLKNAYFVTNELFFEENKEEKNEGPELSVIDILKRQADEANTEHFMRCASPVYVGSGESDDRIQEATRNNVLQAKVFLQKQFNTEFRDIKIHFSCLVTDTAHENQHTMVKHIYAATRDHESSADTASYMPCNAYGTTRPMDIDPQVPGEHDSSITFLNQSERYRRAAQVSKSVRASEFVEVVDCASGMDRTETESSYATKLWKEDRYEAMGKDLNVVNDQQGNSIEQTQARCRNGVELNHMLGGSRGLKNDSRGKNQFDQYDTLYAAETERGMYLKSAETNKDNKVNGSDIKRIKKMPSAIAEMQYDAAKSLLVEAANTYKRVSVENKAKTNPLRKVEIDADATQLVIMASKPTDLGILTRTLLTVADVAETCKSEADPETKMKKLNRLKNVINGLEKRPLFRKIMAGLIIVAGALLITAGALLLIHSGGTSVLAAAFGAKLIAAATATKATVSVASASLIASGVTADYVGCRLFKKPTQDVLNSKTSLLADMNKFRKRTKKNVKKELETSEPNKAGYIKLT